MDLEEINKERNKVMKKAILALEERRDKNLDCKIRPIMESLDSINLKLDIVMPTIKEINEIRSAWKVGGVLGTWTVKFIVGVGIILSAIYAIREWIKKD